MEKTRILFDLKPALDGFAGIPQETRLLFRGLRGSGDTLDVDGLLQHEHQILKDLSAAAGSNAAESAIVDAAGRTVISFFPPPSGGRLLRYIRKFRQLRTLQGLRLRALRNRPVELGTFRADLFTDFIWTQLFDKTLSVADKPGVTSARFRIVSPPRGLMHLAGLKGSFPFVPARYLTLATGGYDFLVAQTPFPAHVSRGTRLVIRYHDAVPLLMPHTIGAKNFHQASHLSALKSNVADGALFVCNSGSTRDALLSVFPSLEARVAVIHNFISDHFEPTKGTAAEARQIICSRAQFEDGQTPPSPEQIPENYLLMVSTIEPRKNHLLMISAWERLRLLGHSGLGLVLVGNWGWDCTEIAARMRPWMQRGLLFHLSGVPAEELSVLYRHATATISPSRSEGFDYSGIEAMRCGGLVISSDIPVHREIFDAGAAYFDPYSVADAVDTIGRIIEPGGENKRRALRRAASRIVSRYRSEIILPQWQSFFETWKNSDAGT